MKVDAIQLETFTHVDEAEPPPKLPPHITYLFSSP